MKWLPVYAAVYLIVAREAFRNSKLRQGLSDKLVQVLLKVRHTLKEDDE